MSQFDLIVDCPLPAVTITLTEGSLRGTSSNCTTSLTVTLDSLPQAVTGLETWAAPDPSFPAGTTHTATVTGTNPFGVATATATIAIPAATYELHALPVAIAEGEATTLTLTTTRVPNGTVLAWELTPGTTTLADTTPNSGTVTVQNNTATWEVTAKIDQLLEQAETFTVRLTAHPGVVSEVVTITADPVPTYSLSTTPVTLAEGEATTATVTTTNVANGTVLDWEVVPGTTTFADTSPNSGTVTIQNNTGTFQVTAQVDQLLEQAETFTIRLTDHHEATSEVVTITAPTYSLSTTPITLAEGEATTATVTTTNVVNGTVLNWEVVPGTTTLADTGPNSGTVTIQNNTATFQVTAQTDAAAEQAETFTIRLTDHHEATSQVVTITASGLTQLASLNRGGWYGGNLSTSEIWVTDVYISSEYGTSCTAYKIHKTTGVNSQITEIPNYDYRREIKKEGNYWFSIVGSQLEVRDLAYSVLLSSGYLSYTIEHDQVEAKTYHITNAGGNWLYGAKTGLIPYIGNGSSETVANSDWVYDADYPSNEQGFKVNEFALSTDYVWYSSVALQKVEAVSRNWESGDYGVTNTIFPLDSAKFNLARKSIPVANSINSRMTCTPNYLFITQPLLGTVARIDLISGNLTSLAIAGLQYTNEAWTSKPSYCVWLPGFERVAVSCLGDNTLKLYTEAGVLTNTLPTGTAPGKAFEVDNLLYVPCMEQAVTNRWSL